MVDLQIQGGASTERGFKESIKAQINLDEKDSFSILKDFLPRTEPTIFTLITPEFFDWSNRISSAFSALKSSSHFLPQSKLSWS